MDIKKNIEKMPEASRTEQASPAEDSLTKDVAFLLIKIAVIVLVFVLVFTFLFGLHRMADPSMNPAIRDGDLLMFYRLNKTYAPGDTILLEFEGKHQVRRVIAMPGDTVDISEKGLTINGAFQQELEIFQTTARYAQGVTFPLTVGEDEIFVLADARENAVDSRIYGTVNINDTLGKVMVVLRRRSI